MVLRLHLLKSILFSAIKLSYGTFFFCWVNCLMAFNYTIWCFCIVNKQRPSDILVRSIMVVSKGFRKKRAQEGIMALF